MSDEKKTLDHLRAEFDELKAHLEHLRVKANLGRKEAREKLHDLEERLTPAYQKAKGQLEQILASGTSEARTLGKSLSAAWEELRRTHRELSEKAELQASDPGAKKP